MNDFKVDDYRPQNRFCVNDGEWYRGKVFDLADFNGDGR